ncbi:bifunctional hydroxymethylpyrimidine kinase/phosphomethylpyrimidine kinase [Paracoccus saliphilus]|uniref:hydroxymethylpyrimidine kinase n=1 Tax=Paracoccus saliphilus TaxID=405559 RepID=A0AA46A5E3_9RHOB|nr:bifunctional hydroxymethylpyrimidine kinase/phosphomethylpyrimidine kinase [Paracoccus saliphilus]WCR04294.1 bifunctional hydroxymethylpyrimidine kinase/phosphomethylpyrimidine kinase [Paracoccus saliphilus]SIS79906.1 hydroxymethylpyrimidine kinase /phosphomethylpyrimidine kinase [Paracoccus saliphilus]
MIPNILSIAGSDPSGGAGIQADLKAISANGGYGMAAITALTVQNTQGVSAVQMVPPDFVAAQIGAVFDDIRVDAVKIGMLGDAAVIAAVARALEGRGCPIVLDPVMVAKGGDRLLAVDAVAALRELLIPRATIITPNLPEAADLLGCAEARDRAGMEAQASALMDLGPQAVLLKGGHLGGADSPDLLVSANRIQWLESARHATRNSHGTGCTLSSALATQLALSEEVGQAVEAAKSYVYRALIAADRLRVGQGHGPLDHFWALR